MATFLALYRGNSIGSADLLAVSTDRDLIAQVATQLLADRDGPPGDEALDALHAGRRRALELVRNEAGKPVT